MVVVSKADASISDGTDDKSYPTSSDHPFPVGTAPPDYEETVAEGSHLIDDERQVDLPAATNHYYEKKLHGAIRGIWNIDTKLVIPTSIATPNDLAQGYHLYLETGNGSVNARIALTSGASNAAKAFLSTRNGEVVCRVITRTANQPIKITLKTNNGAIIVGLPRSFHGSLSHITSSGEIKFSPELESKITLHRGDHSFVGSLTNLTDSESYNSTWPGDEVAAETHNGAIKFSYVDELEHEHKHGVVGGIKSFFGLKQK